MQLYHLGDIKDKKEFLSKLGVQQGGISIIAKKMKLLHFYIKDLKTPAINILKQDALSIGAELAVPSGVILCEKPFYDCVLIGTLKHIEILSKKELAQPFGLKNVALELKKFLKTPNYPTKIMAIINANDDSFFKDSRFKDNKAIKKIKEYIKDGANIVDIGGVSSRPNAKDVSVEEELKRVKPICDVISEKKLYEKTIFSIDSYAPKVVEYALKRGFKIINDITGASNDEIICLAIKYGVKLCIMHKQGTPKTMQIAPKYEDVVIEVSQFFEQQIKKCEDLGLNKKDIILDVGIGFGKTLEHNITLIKNLHHFKNFGCEILIGASRKSLIDHITPTPIEDRLEGTLALHFKALQNGANIIRCHDVKEHKKFLDVWEALS